MLFALLKWLPLERLPSTFQAIASEVECYGQVLGIFYIKTWNSKRAEKGKQHVAGRKIVCCFVLFFHLFFTCAFQFHLCFITVSSCCHLCFTFSTFFHIFHTFPSFCHLFFIIFFVGLVGNPASSMGWSYLCLHFVLLCSTSLMLLFKNKFSPPFVTFSTFSRYLVFTFLLVCHLFLPCLVTLILTLVLPFNNRMTCRNHYQC